MKEDFLQRLSQNEDDLETRLVYADWLEENGEPDEANRMRLWPASKEWLKNFIESKQPETCLDYGYNKPNKEWVSVTYEMVMKHLEEHECFVQIGSETLRDCLTVDNIREFWEHWSIVTGKPLPEDYKYGPFSCSC